MRYLWSTLLLLLLGLGPMQAAPAKRKGASKSTLSSVRNKQKFNRKPNVYNAKRNRPAMAKKSHWWTKK